ncbi:MAG: 50S ribosomal protein L11 methyltransferase [Bacteroidota bacterium]
MSARTIELTVFLADELHDFLIAELADLDFDTFVQDEDQLKAYTLAAQWDGVKREHVEQWLVAQGLGPHALQEQLIDPENWNASWEASLQAVPVGPFVIKPSGAEIPPACAGRIVLHIDPKMSFGTGYHESTRLILRSVKYLVRPGMTVLDAGTGTGILGIGAIKLGAARAVAFDIDGWAKTNGEENAVRNGVAEAMDFREGGIEVISEDGFDVVLANINRNALLDLMPAFAQKTQPDGYLVLAGLLQTDRQQILSAAKACGFRYVREAIENEWWSVVMQRTAP